MSAPLDVTTKSTASRDDLYSSQRPPHPGLRKCRHHAYRQKARIQGICVRVTAFNVLQTCPTDLTHTLDMHANLETRLVLSHSISIISSSQMTRIFSNIAVLVTAPSPVCCFYTCLYTIH